MEKKQMDMDTDIFFVYIKIDGIYKETIDVEINCELDWPLPKGK